MVVLVLSWLALSIIAALAFVFGSGLGYRRGVEQTRAAASGRAGSPQTPPGITVELRLAEEVAGSPTWN